MSYRALADKVDGFFARVEARHGDQMQCASGCSDCCHARLTVTPVERAAIEAELATWDAERRAALHAHADRPDDGICAALVDGRCAIYQARPMVCRSHGAPIRIRTRVEVCHRNFADHPERADADCILDQTTLSAMVLAVNRAVNADPEDRTDLAALIVRATR